MQEWHLNKIDLGILSWEAVQVLKNNFKKKN